jgi:hypothetical protein
MDSERAETYLRDLAESELRRWRGGDPQGVPEATARVRAVAAAFVRTGALDSAVADAAVDDLVTALDIRSPGDQRARSMVSHIRRAYWSHRAPGAVTPAGAGPISVTPVGELLELRDGDTDVDVYLVGAIRSRLLRCLGAGVLSLPKGSLPGRAKERRGLPPGKWPSSHPGLPGVPGDLRAVDENGQSYDLIFNGQGEGTWSVGQFVLGNQGLLPRERTRLDVGNEEHSVRINLTGGPAAAEVTTTLIDLSAGEQYLRIRAEAMFASGSHDIGTDLAPLAALVPALRAVGALPEDSVPAGQIAALCRRYAVACDGIADPPAAVPDRWTDLLTSEYGSWRQATGADPPPAAASLPVTFPESDGVTTVLSGLVTRGRRTAVLGAFFGAVEEGYAEGPCIWLRDDGGQWHVAKPGSRGSGGLNVFAANVVPPVAASVTAVDVLIISRTAEVRASVPLTWWTS